MKCVGATELDGLNYRDERTLWMCTDGHQSFFSDFPGEDASSMMAWLKHRPLFGWGWERKWALLQGPQGTGMTNLRPEGQLSQNTAEFWDCLGAKASEKKKIVSHNPSRHHGLEMKQEMTASEKAEVHPRAFTNPVWS